MGLAGGAARLGHADPGWIAPAGPPRAPTASMKPPTDYIRHAARVARKIQMDAAMGGTPQPDADFYKALAKPLEEIAAGLELASARE